jgi:membrane fusion protein (multidrug efflux system)
VGEARAKLAKAKADLASAKASVEVVKARADLVRDQATLANAEKDLARVRPLAEATAVSIQELDLAETKAKESAAVVDASKAVLRQSQVNEKTKIALAEADVQQTSAALATAQLNLGYTRVGAPINGRIGKGAINVGSLVGKGENSLLATISRLDSIYVYFSVSEQQYLTVAPLIDIDRPDAHTAKTQIELVLADGKVFPEKGRIDFIDRAVDPQTGTLQVRTVFANPSQLLRPGQFARVRVSNPDPAPTLVIPQRAVMEQQGEQFVMVVNDQGNVDRRKVKMGARVDSLWIVEDGLQAGQQVITDGLQKARPGMTVKPLKTDR